MFLHKLSVSFAYIYHITIEIEDFVTEAFFRKKFLYGFLRSTDHLPEASSLHKGGFFFQGFREM